MTGRIGPSPVMSIIQPFTIDTMLNSNGPLLNSCLKTLHVNKASVYLSSFSSYSKTQWNVFQTYIWDYFVWIWSLFTLNGTEILNELNRKMNLLTCTSISIFVEAGIADILTARFTVNQSLMGT